MKIGIHVRVSGGYAKAVEHAKTAGCTALQVFSSNPRSYRTSPIDASAMESFARLRRDAGLVSCAIHTPYLINLASEDPKIADGSVHLLRNDLKVAALGRMQLVNTHLGSYGNRDRAAGFTAVCRALEASLQDIAPDVVLVLENSAGAGNLVGGTLEELGAFIKAVDHRQLGVCLDTAHAWAAGYQIDSKEGVARFLAEADESIGLERIALFHFNDTQVPLGASRDRHWHIGEGNIGFEGFRALLAHERLAEKPAILETPGDDADDIRNVQTLLSIQRGTMAAT